MNPGDLADIFHDICRKNEDDPTKTANELMDMLRSNAKPSSTFMFMNPKEKKAIIMMEDGDGGIIFDSDYLILGAGYYEQLEDFFRKEFEKEMKEEKKEEEKE